LLIYVDKNVKGNRELREQTLKTKTVKPFGYGKVMGTEGKNEESEQGRWKEKIAKKKVRNDLKKEECE